MDSMLSKFTLRTQQKLTHLWAAASFKLCEGWGARICPEAADSLSTYWLQPPLSFPWGVGFHFFGGNPFGPASGDRRACWLKGRNTFGGKNPRKGMKERGLDAWGEMSGRNRWG